MYNQKALLFVQLLTCYRTYGYVAAQFDELNTHITKFIPQNIPRSFPRMGWSLLKISSPMPDANSSPTLSCHGEGFYRHPSDCTKFYRCITEFGNTDYTPIIFTCAPGAIFSQEIVSCVSGSCSRDVPTDEISPSELPTDSKNIQNQQDKGSIIDPTNGLRSSNVDISKLQKICRDNENKFFCLDCKVLVMCIGRLPQIIPCGYGNTCYSAEKFRGGVCHPKAPINCTCNNEDIFRPDIYDSSKFLTCVSQGAEPVIQSCPDGLEFNETFSSCGAPINTTCSKTGTFAVQSDCTKYHTCTYTTAGLFFQSVFTCDNNTMYNEEKGKCEDPCDWYRGNFTCEKEGRFPNPEDCTKFFECITDPIDSESFIKVEHACREGFEWLLMDNVHHCVAKGTTKEKCVPQKPNTCNVPREWCLPTKAECSPRCLNGECTGPNICQCRPGWTGNLCQTRKVDKVDFSLAKIGQTTHHADKTADKAFLTSDNYFHSALEPPQALWFGFAIPVPVVKFSFQSRPDNLAKEDGATKYVFFGSNSDDCSDKSSWIPLVEDNSGTPFTKANTPKTELVPGNKSFTCYGFNVKAIHGRDIGYKRVTMDNIKLYTTGLQELDLDSIGIGATSYYNENERPENAFVISGANPVRHWQSEQGTFPGTPQSIWYQFPIPVVVAEISFRSRFDGYVVDCGPSSYEIFGSNAPECSDQSSWVTLFQDHSNTPFTSANEPKSAYIPNPEPYLCYGIKVLSIPSNYGSAITNIKFFPPNN